MWREVLYELLNLVGVLLAVFLGFAIGFERKLRYKEAGIRTHIIVCVGAALLTVVSKYGFGGDSADSARVAAQIVSGIGFLGAGIIMFRGQKMCGLTTAAGVWTTAGVGMAAGAGLYIVCRLPPEKKKTVQCICHIKCRLFLPKRFYHLNIVFKNTQAESERIKELFCVEHFNSLVIRRDDGCTVYSAVLNTDKEYSSQRLNEIMAENDYIISLERCDQE